MYKVMVSIDGKIDSWSGVRYSTKKEAIKEMETAWANPLVTRVWLAEQIGERWV